MREAERGAQVGEERIGLEERAGIVVALALLIFAALCATGTFSLSGDAASAAVAGSEYCQYGTDQYGNCNPPPNCEYGSDQYGNCNPPPIDTIAPTLTGVLSPQPNSAGWEMSPTTLTLTATDNPGGSGVRSITCNGVAAPGASRTLTFTASAVVTETCTTADNAGNVSAPQAFTVRVDRIPPELYLVWNPSTQRLDAFGTDTGGSGLAGVTSTVPRRNEVSYEVSDVAGNTLVALVKITSGDGQIEATFVSLSYDGGPVETAPSNKLDYTWVVNRRGVLITLDQDIQVGAGREHVEVDATYHGRRNETTIRTDPGGHAQRVGGLVLEKVSTSAGGLKIGP